MALDELGTVMGKKKCFIVTDTFLYKNGYVAPIEAKLDQLGIQHTCFYDVAPDPNLSSALKGAQAMRCSSRTASSRWRRLGDGRGQDHVGDV